MSASDINSRSPTLKVGATLKRTAPSLGSKGMGRDRTQATQQEKYGPTVQCFPNSVSS